MAPTVLLPSLHRLMGPDHHHDSGIVTGTHTLFFRLLSGFWSFGRISRTRMDFLFVVLGPLLCFGFSRRWGWDSDWIGLRVRLGLEVGDTASSSLSSSSSSSSSSGEEGKEGGENVMRYPYVYSMEELPCRYRHSMSQFDHLYCSCCCLPQGSGMTPPILPPCFWFLMKAVL
jgi:hypothetical protein